MAGCKRCALKGEKRGREKDKKRKEKRRKNGDQNRFFISPCACFFHMRSGHFSNICGKLYLDLEDHIRYFLR